MEKINTLEEVRSAATPTTEINVLTMRLSGERAKIIGRVEEFVSLSGAKHPVDNVLSLFSEYLHVCEYMEKLAIKAEQEGNDEAGAIRDGYLPTFAILADQFYYLKELVILISELGAADSYAKELERGINAIQSVTGISPDEGNVRLANCQTELDREKSRNEHLQQLIEAKERTINVLMKEQ